MLGLPSAGAHQDLASQRPASPRAHATLAEPGPAAPRAQVTQQPKIVSIAVSRPGRPYYVNPLRSVSGLVPERIDEGVDFGGSGPVYALGDAIVTNAGENAGWPGGGWITYRLTDGPDAGLMVYLAEDVTPTVQTGQHVTPSTVIANMFNGGDGIETGWAQPTGVSAESELPEAGGIGGGGPFPTRVGLNFDQLLQSAGSASRAQRRRDRIRASSGQLPDRLEIATAPVARGRRPACGRPRWPGVVAARAAPSWVLPNPDLGCRAGGPGQIMVLAGQAPGASQWGERGHE